MQGASAIQTVLEQHPAAPLRAFIVWEAVLVSDAGPPDSYALALLADRRTVHFWDPNRLLSQKILETTAGNPQHTLAQCCLSGKVVWDVVALYPKGMRWEGGFPSPSFGGRRVIEAAGELGRHLSLALADR